MMPTYQLCSAGSCDAAGEHFGESSGEGIAGSRAGQGQNIVSLNHKIHILESDVPGRFIAVRVFCLFQIQ